MDVELYVYDLSQGLARNVSAALIGVQLDAIYHTSIVLERTEYVYDGGIQMIAPAGTTHLGKPMQILKLGCTLLPMDVILDYLDSMRPIYTAEAYDLWRHNCNNFSNDFATFLLGKGIPDHIRNLPQAVLDSPFSQMLQPTIDDMLRNSRHREYGTFGIGGPASAQNMPRISRRHVAAIKTPKTVHDLDSILSKCTSSCAVIFFTAQNCGPCKTLYPLYEELAAEAGQKGTLIIVDVEESHDIGTQYSISATPTFITFLKGKQENRWSGADPSKLRGNMKLLLEMAWPPHPHESLRLSILRGSSTKPILYSKVPPLEKLLSKIGGTAGNAAVQGIKNSIVARAVEGAAETTLPDLDGFSWFIRDSIQHLPPQTMFAVVDLLRAALADPRFSGYFAEEVNHRTIAPLIEYVNSQQNCPYSLRLVTLQASCNLFSSPLFIEQILCCQTLTLPVLQLITTSLLDHEHHNVRVVAASLSFNIATANSKLRTEEYRESLPEGNQVELAASLLEAIGAEEESPEALKGFLLAFGHLVYCAPKNGELVDLLKSMDAQETVMGKSKPFPIEPLIAEIGMVLLGEGL